MHFLILGRPRCRTSFVCDVLGNLHDASNFHESFDNTDQIKNQVIRSKLTKVQNLQNRILEVQKKHCTKITNDVFNEKNAVIKLFTRHLVYPSDSIKEQFFEHKNYPYFFNKIDQPHFLTITDYIDIFQLKRYDEIFFLDRDLVTSTLSYVFNILVMKSPLYSSENQIKVLKQKNITITIEENLYPYINFYVYEYIIQTQIKKDLQNSNIKFTELNYDDCIPYITNRFNKMPVSKFSDTKLDYSTIITNYSEIQDYINQTYTILSKHHIH